MCEDVEGLVLAKEEARERVAGGRVTSQERGDQMPMRMRKAATSLRKLSNEVGEML